MQERERERRLYRLPAVTTLAISHPNISSFERKVFLADWLTHFDSLQVIIVVICCFCSSQPRGQQEGDAGHVLHPRPGPLPPQQGDQHPQLRPQQGHHHAWPRPQLRLYIGGQMFDS